MSLLKVNEVQNYNGSSLTLTASTVSTSAQLNTGGNISVTGSINVSDDSTTRSNLGLGSIATQDSDNVTVTGGTATLGALTVSGTDGSYGELFTNAGEFTIRSTGNGASATIDGFITFDVTDSGTTSEAMRIQSSGYVLVGKTASTGESQGCELRPQGQVLSTNDGSWALQCRRLTNDGSIIILFAGTTQIGTIGCSNSSTAIFLSAPNENIGIKIVSDDLRATNGSGVDADNTMDLGNSNVRWDDVYATNGTIQTSDANEKENITTSDLSLDFIRQLNPVSYKFIGKTRTHYGLIAQEIETLLSTIGKESTDFAGFIKSPVIDDDGNETGEYKYGLRYHEFISPMIKAIQEQQSQIDALTARIQALEATP